MDYYLHQTGTKVSGLCQLIRNEFYKTKVIFESTLLKTLSKIEFASNYENMPKNTIHEEQKVMEELKKLYNRAIKFNCELSNHVEHLNIMNELCWEKTILFSRRQSGLIEFREGYNSNCVIVNIEEDASIIYIYDLKNAKQYDNFYSMFYTKFKSNCFRDLENEPSTNEVFGVVRNNCIYRVVRKNNITFNNKFVGLLIDHGKAVELSIHNTFYLLPSDIQSHPALANRCQVDNIINQSKVEFFQTGLHKRYLFSINKVCNTYLQITVTAHINPFTQELSENETKWFNSELFLRKNDCLYLISQKNNNKVSQAVIPNYLSISTDLKQFLELSLSTNAVEKEDYPKKEEIECTQDKVTEQLKILNEEPTMCTTNALKAVMGYVPKDELRICQFTNDKGDCFKGIHCNKEHQLKIPGGWTRDQQPLQIDIPIKCVIPGVGCYISIIPTHLINVTTFYGHVLYKENLYSTTLQQLTLMMNASKQINKYLSFSPNNLPQECELVIAKHQDGLYYRARVVSETNNGCRVFYVDYGNEVDADYTNLRKWEKQFEALPFQAIRFQLVNVKTKVDIANNKELLTQAEKFLTTNFLDSKFLAKVINNTNELIIKINFTLDNKDFDFSELLVQKGFAEYKGSDYINCVSSNFSRVPG